MTRLFPIILLALTLGAALALEWADPILPEANPPPRPERARTADAGEPAEASDAEQFDEQVDAILARPIFNPSRRPGDMPAEVVAANAETLPRLSGVLFGPSGRRAIFAPAAGKSLVLAEGDRIGRYTIRSIAPNNVTLSGSEGDRLIRPSHSTAPRPNERPADGTSP